VRQSQDIQKKRVAHRFSASMRREVRSVVEGCYTNLVQMPVPGWVNRCTKMVQLAPAGGGPGIGGHCYTVGRLPRPAFRPTCSPACCR
jgi:hypothetical protein